MTQITALVPMRHHSQRVPGKNYRPLNGKPLYEHIISTLMTCPGISKIAVDTDSEPIMLGLRQNFPDVHIIERPQNLCADECSMNEILTYDTTRVEADFYLQTHSTNPFLSAATITKAIDTFLKHYPSYDSLFGVTRLQNRLWDQLTRPINHNPAILLQTQDLPPVYQENSCIYIFTREILLERRNRLGERPYMFEIDAQEALDIDNELDFLVTEYLLEKLRKRAD